VDFGAGYLGYEREDIGFRVFACLDGLPVGDDGVCVEVCADDGALLYEDSLDFSDLGL